MAVVRGYQPSGAHLEDFVVDFDGWLAAASETLLGQRFGRRADRLAFRGSNVVLIIENASSPGALAARRLAKDGFVAIDARR